MSSSEEYQSSSAHEPSSEEEEEDDDDDEEEEEEWNHHSSSRNKPSKSKTSRARRAKTSSSVVRRNPRRYTTGEMNREISAMKRGHSENDDDDEQEEEDVSSDDDEPEEVTPKTKRPSKKRTGYKLPSAAQKAKKKTTPKKRKQTKGSSEDDASSESQDDWDQNESDSQTDHDTDDESIIANKKRPRRSVTRSPATRSRRGDQELTPSSSSGRPKRRCTALTQRRMNDAVRADRMTEKEALGGVLEESEVEMLDSEDDGGGGDDGGGSSDDDEEVRLRRGRAADGRDRKKKNKYDEDDDYNEKEGLFNDDSSEEEEEDGEDYESDEGVTNSRPLRRSTRNNTKSYVDVDEQDIGTADEDSGDEDTGPSILVSPAKNNRSGIMSYGSPKLRGKARASKKPLSLEEDSGEEDNTSDRSDDDDSNHNLTYFQHKCTQKQSPTKLKTTTICCPSKIDEITMMPLPAGKPHICFVSPDGNTRHCFTLETFYRIAISAKTSDGQNILATDNSRLQFLQPPHFRTPISDDLLDQIASRFGRGALIIENSTLYKKMKQRSTGGFRGDVDVEDEMEEMFDSDGEYVGSGGRGESGSGQNFDERFRRYVQNLMGSQDVYCCPLCYNEAYRRLGNMGHDEMIEDDASDEDDEDDGDVNDKKEDRFSFLDDPMTILGHLDHQEFEIASTFCFRLLIGVKNHLRSVHLVDLTVLEGNDLFKRFQIRAGDGLLQSWLRKSLKKSMVQGDMMRYWNEGENQAFLLLLNQMDKGELKGDQSGSSGSDFSLSFPNRARKVWAELCSPFLKVQDDIEDFLADDDEDAESCAVPINPHFTPPTNQTEQVKSPEEKMLEYLQKKNASHAASSSENESESEESSVELEVLSKEDIEDEEEEEEEVEDEWTRSKQYLPKQEARKRSSRNKDESDNDSAMFDVPKTPINDDFRKEIGNDDDDKPITRVNGSARKHIADSSDEES